MTKINKIATSVVASAFVVGGSAFAGTLNYSVDGTVKSDKLVVAEELFVPTANINIVGDNTTTGAVPAYRYDESTISYTAEINGSESVSDATINLKFNAGTISVGTDYKVVMVDVADSNKIIAVQNDSVDADKIVLDSDDSYMVRDGHQYNLFVLDEDNAILGATGITRSDDGGYIRVNGTKADIEKEELKLELWSASGTEEERDEAKISMFTVAPQYKVSCETKLNNLINVENASTVFVSTKHGALNDVNGSNGDVMDVLSDVMRFNVEKFAVDIGLDGSRSRVEIASTQPISDANVTHNFVYDNMSGQGNWVSANVVQLDTINTQGGTYYGLDASKNTFTAKFTFDGNTTIPETQFTSNFYINYDDVRPYTTYTPAKDYKANTYMGEWKNFAYIAQVPGATNDDATKTKLFITNRSCKAVSPVITFIYDGKTVNVTAPSINVNAQGKIILDTIIDANKAAFDAAGIPTRARYAIEITIPGNAEDFYIYAQAQSRTKVEATKDLPVYNTSTRTY